MSARPRVVVVDYGVGNLFSVCRAFTCLGADVMLSGDPDLVARADRLVVPGVGAFGRCMAELAAHGLTEVVISHALSGRPWLGICVGMQMMLQASDEFGDHAGLGLIEGRVRAIPLVATDGARLKVPHIGWNRLEPAEGAVWAQTPLAAARPGDAVYFVHSFSAHPVDPSVVLATVPYGGQSLVVAVRSGNAFGVQFHPEKSDQVGLGVVKSFLTL